MLDDNNLRMKKCLFMLFALCAVAFTACDESEEGAYKNKIVPKLSPNKDIQVGANGGTQVLTVLNGTDVKITQINDKLGASGKETNVKKISDGTIKDPRNVTEGGWFTATVEQEDGVYKKIVFEVTPNSGDARTKYIHISCGENMLGAAFMIIQEKPATDTNTEK